MITIDFTLPWGTGRRRGGKLIVWLFFQKPFDQSALAATRRSSDEGEVAATIQSSSLCGRVNNELIISLG